MTIQGPQGFWETEKYTSIDLTTDIKDLKSKGIRIYGLYGKEDGLYSSDQINKLAELIGKNNIMYLDNCSHSVFIDQQTTFIHNLKTWSK
jgi:proline iminopeptidase